MQQILSSDVILISFSLLLGGLVGMFWERSRTGNDGDSKSSDKDRRNKS